jgi:hypothetical protein
MAKLYCPRCGPVRPTLMRSSAGLDLDSLRPGPVPGSRCGSCGGQLYAGSSTTVRQAQIQEERYRPFVLGAIIGCVVWSISGGAIHAYVISPNWEAMGNRAASALAGWQAVVALICVGLAFGLAVEVSKFVGAVLRSQGAVLLFPLLAGATVGSLQGVLVVSDWWGFAASTVFRSDDLRIWTGAVCGFILCYPVVLIGIALRRTGLPW